MADNTLTLALEGDVLLEQFAESIRHFSNLVDTLSREVAEGVKIEWVIDDLHAGSATATIVGLYPEEEYVQNVIQAYSVVGRSLAMRTPIPYSGAVSREAQAITKILNGKITAVRFETAESDFTVYGQYEEGREGVSPRVSFGSVKGRVQALSSRGKLKFTLYDNVFDKPVSCYLKDGEEDKMRAIWGRIVVVTGRVTREPDHGRAISIREVTVVDTLPEVQPGSYVAARGVLDWSEGDEPADVSIRRMRDAQS